MNYVYFSSSISLVLILFVRLSLIFLIDPKLESNLHSKRFT